MNTKNTTKADLEKSLRNAHDALAYNISVAHRAIMRARRACRKYPACGVFPIQLECAVEQHDQLKRIAATWTEGDVATIRSRAAQFVRKDLETSRRFRTEAAELKEAA